MNENGFPIQNQLSAPVMERAERPRNYGAIDPFDGHAKITGPCGDTMEFWIRVNEGLIEAIGFTTTGCGPSRAAGSMATELVIGRAVKEAEQLQQPDILEALNGLPSESEHCALLAVNTLKAAVKHFQA